MIKKNLYVPYFFCQSCLKIKYLIYCFFDFSYISGVTILGTPAEIYRFGTQYCVIAVAIWISGAVVATVYLPVFCKLQLYSSYEVKNLFHYQKL